MSQLEKNIRVVLKQSESGGMSAVQTKFLDQVDQGKNILTVATPNPEQLVMSAEDKVFWKALQSMQYLIPDGVGLQLAYVWWKLTGRGSEFPHQFRRVAGRRVVEWWLTHAKKQKTHSTLLVGAKSGVAERLAQKVDPKTEWCLGSMGYSQVQDLWSEKPSAQTQTEHAELMNLISDWQPTVIFVAFGAPYQEMWIEKYSAELQKSGVRIVMVCGGAFDTLVGDTSPAPSWIARIGAEWLWRLIAEPWRWRRQLRLITFLQEIF